MAQTQGNNVLQEQQKNNPYSYQTPPVQQSTTPYGAWNQAQGYQRANIFRDYTEKKPSDNGRYAYEVTLDEPEIVGTNRQKKVSLQFPNQEPRTRIDSVPVTGPYNRQYTIETPPNNPMSTVNGAETQVGDYGKAGGAPVTTGNQNWVEGNRQTIVPQQTQPQTQPTDNSYVGQFNEKKKQADEEKAKAVPTSKDGGKGLTGWLKRNFGNDGTPNGKRRALQNITALTQMLRHAVNLYGVSKHAYNQQIDDQFSKNEARFKQEDAEQAARDKAQKEWERQLAKDKADRDDKDRNFSLKVADYNRGLAKDKLDADYKKGQANRDQQRVDIAVGAQKHKEEQDAFNNDLNTKKFEEQKKNGAATRAHLRSSDRLGWARLNLDKQKEARIKAQGGGLSYGGTTKKGEHIVTTPSGSRYVVSKNFMDNIELTYNRMRKKKACPEAASGGVIEVNGVEFNTGSGKPSKMAMLDAIMQGADTNTGHDDFVYWGKKYGYRYVDGMSADKARELGIKKGYKGARV